MQGAINSYVVAAVVLLLWFGLTRFISVFAPTFQHAGKAALFILYAGHTLRAWAIYIYGKRKRGPLLNDIGQHHAKTPILLVAALLLLLGLNTLAGYNSFHWTLSILFFSAAAFSFFAAFGRLSVHQNGLWVYNSLIHWHSIDTYRWSQSTLIIQRTGLSSCLLRNALPIPESSVHGAEELLGANVKRNSAA